MRKIAAFMALITALAVTVSACGKSETNNNTTAEKEQTTIAEKDTETSADRSSGAESAIEETSADENVKETENANMKKVLLLFIGDDETPVEWENNESVAALAELVSSEPLTIQMSGYGGFEQVGSLGAKLPRDDVQITTGAGDIVLYSGDQIVIFYGSNSWAYTKLGRITDRTDAEIADLLSNGDVTIMISNAER